MPRPPAGGVRRLPSGKVQARIQFGGDTFTGLFAGAGAEGRALDYLAELRHRQRQSEISTSSAGRTLREQLDSFLDSIRGTVGPKTWGEYERNAHHHLLALLDLPLADLTPERLRRHILVTLTSEPWSLAPRTLRAVRGTLRRALDLAIEDGHLDKNPAARIRLPKMGPHRQHVHSRAEQRKLIASAEAADDRLRALWVLNYRIGLRLSEALGLTWDEVDLDNGLVAVTRQLERTDAGRPVWKDATKGDSGAGVLHLPRSAVEALRQHRARQDGERLRFGSSYQDFNLIFARQRGTALAQHDANTWWKRACRRADVPEIVFHEGRHTAASSYLASGAKLADVQGVLRHASPHVTASIYSHVLERTSRAPAEALDAYLDADSDASRGVVGTAGPLRLVEKAGRE